MQNLVALDLGLSNEGKEWNGSASHTMALFPQHRASLQRVAITPETGNVPRTGKMMGKHVHSGVLCALLYHALALCMFFKTLDHP